MKVGATSTIGEVTSIVTKGTTPTTLGRQFASHGIGFIKAECISNDGALIVEKQVYIDEETDQLLKRSRLHKDDVLFSIAGVIGRTAIVRQSALPANTNQAIAILRPDPKLITPKFLYYSVRAKEFQDHSLGHVVQTAQANVSLGVLSAAPIWLPPLATQHRIAGILSAYDELIDNSQKRINILESIARALYREWFVYFRYPGHESVPLVPSALGGIPQGWGIKTLGDISSHISRGISPQYNEDGDSVVINQKCIRNQRLSLEPARRQTKSIPNEKQLRFGDVLINSTGVGTLGRVAQVYERFEKHTVDSHVSIARAADNIDLNFYGSCLLNHQEMFERLGIGATGQTELSRAAIAGLDVVVPPIEIQLQFGEVVGEIRTAIENSGKQIQNLRQTRDLLLPRLLSGQIDVEAIAS
jgi:type I restriction enzyme S subunit